MFVLTIHLTLLDKSKGRLESTPRADMLETVQDLLILTVFLGEEKDKGMEKKGGNKGSTKNLSPSYMPFPGSFFSFFSFSLCYFSFLLLLLCPSLDMAFTLS